MAIFTPSRRVLLAALAVLLAVPLAVSAQVPSTATDTAAADPAAAGPRVALDTSKGRIVLVLDPEKAPLSVANFLGYVEDGFYDGTVFHRVIPGFMVQGGGFTPDLVKKETGPPVRNESPDGLSNLRGTIAMARTPDPHSATAQFFINTVDNPRLDAGAAGPWGYTVFGRVVEGMETVEAIAGVATGTQRSEGMPMQNVPVEPVVIERATVLAAGDAEADAEADGGEG